MPDDHNLWGPVCFARSIIFGGVPGGYSVSVVNPSCPNVNAILSTDEIGEQYLRARIGGNPVTLKELAAQHSRSYDALRKAAARGRWSSKAAIATAQRDADVAAKMRQLNPLTTCVLEQAAESEVDVRCRHQQPARCLQQAALERLVSIRPGELSVKLAVEMLRIGIDAERMALGLGDVAPKLLDDGDDNLHVKEAVEEANEILAHHAERLTAQNIAPEYEKAGNSITTPPSSAADDVPLHCTQLQ